MSTVAIVSACIGLAIALAFPFFRWVSDGIEKENAKARSRLERNRRLLKAGRVAVLRETVNRVEARFNMFAFAVPYADWMANVKDCHREYWKSQTDANLPVNNWDGLPYPPSFWESDWTQPTKEEYHKNWGRLAPIAEMSDFCVQLMESVRLFAIQFVDSNPTHGPAYCCDDETWENALFKAYDHVWGVEETNEARVFARMPTAEEWAELRNRKRRGGPPLRVAPRLAPLRSSENPEDGNALLIKSAQIRSLAERFKPRSLCVSYHGTSVENAKAILNDGYFKAGTFFAKHLEDALGYGGPVIFEVVTPSSWWGDCPKVGESADGRKWQHMIEKPLPTSSVVKIVQYESNTILHRPDLQNMVFLNNL